MEYIVKLTLNEQEARKLLQLISLGREKAKQITQADGGSSSFVLIEDMLVDNLDKRIKNALEVIDLRKRADDIEKSLGKPA